MSGFVIILFFSYILCMIEIWKPMPVDGYEKDYEISNLGRARSVDRYVNDNGGLKFCKGKILKPAINNCGYHMISLSKNQKLHTFRLCRLVAKAFVPNPYNLPCVNHKDECKTNDIYTNLEWVDYKTNCNYGTRNERISKKQNRKSVRCVETGEVFQSLTEIQRTTKYNRCYISMACRGKFETAYGKHWEFI